MPKIFTLLAVLTIETDQFAGTETKKNYLLLK
jgi:hypothetical protein